MATGTINDGLLKQIDSVPVHGFAEDLEAQGLMPQDISPDIATRTLTSS